LTTDIKKLEKWLKKKSFSIIFDKNVYDYIDFELNTIFIRSTLSNDSKVAGILHECGHLFERLNENFNEMLPTINRIKRKNSLRCYIETLTDEIIAWQIGEKLIGELKLKIKVEKYRRLRDVNIKTYIALS
jgi:hypothetical protein